MKEKLNNRKGITLIALIITIIVLLILAMVSIKLVLDGGIIEHANNAVTSYNKAQINELEELNEIENKLVDIQSVKQAEWWRISKEDLDKMEDLGDGWSKFIALNSNDESSMPAVVCSYNKERNNEIVAIGVHTQSKHLIYCTDNIYNLDKYYWENEVKGTNKWYTNEGAGFGTLALYEGECPISQDELKVLTKYISDEWFEGLVNSFNK